jgi:type IV secretory pathway protease TraF
MTRFGYVMTTYLAMLTVGVLAFFHPAPRLIWNATASTPTGLYALRPGQTVCRAGDTVTVDHAEVGTARDRDHLGRPLPRWSGCRVLGAREVFLMNPTVPDSLDGRYFGPLPVTSIVARAVPLWTDEAGDSRFVWHAATD